MTFKCSSLHTEINALTTVAKSFFCPQMCFEVFVFEILLSIFLLSIKIMITRKKCHSLCCMLFISMTSEKPKSGSDGLMVPLSYRKCE